MNLADVIAPTIPAQEPIAFFNNLPNATTAFELTQLPETDYYGFYNAVYAQQSNGTA
jgi:hypothetical protein